MLTAATWGPVTTNPTESPLRGASRDIPRRHPAALKDRVGRRRVAPAAATAEPSPNRPARGRRSNGPAARTGRQARGHADAVPIAGHRYGSPRRAPAQPAGHPTAKRLRGTRRQRHDRGRGAAAHTSAAITTATGCDRPRTTPIGDAEMRAAARAAALTNSARRCRTGRSFLLLQARSQGRQATRDPFAHHLLRTAQLLRDRCVGLIQHHPAKHRLALIGGIEPSAARRSPRPHSSYVRQLLVVELNCWHSQPDAA